METGGGSEAKKQKPAAVAQNTHKSRKEPEIKADPGVAAPASSSQSKAPSMRQWDSVVFVNGG